MEMESKGFTKLAFIDSSHSYADKHDMVSNITRLIGSLLDLRDCLDNSLSISVSIDVSIGPDAEYLENTDFDDDDDDDTDNSEICPDPPTAVVDGKQYRIGDEIVVINPAARIGNTNLFHRTGKIAKLPNHNTQMFMVQFNGISADVPMHRDEFNDLPF